MPEIAPSILAADFARLGEEVAAVASAGVKLIHIDVMDGRFVPNISIGQPVVQSLRKATDLYLESHLMVLDPDPYIRDFVQAGSQRVIIHQETCPHLHRSLQSIVDEGAQAGVTINPATPLSTLEHVLEMVDLVLIMSVNPGFGGQKFLPFALDKIRDLARLREERGLDFLIEVDGGVKHDNAGEIARAGADLLVAGSSIFGTPDPAQAVESMKERIADSLLLRA